MQPDTGLPSFTCVNPERVPAHFRHKGPVNPAHRTPRK